MAYSYADTGAHPTPPRKGEDQDQHILREFQRKITEDEGYISYFTERVRIEQAYIDALTKLHSKSVGSDLLQDDAPHPRARVTASARRAWFEVRDYTQREIESREAWANALKSDVLNPLINLRGTQTRIQKRIAEDLEAATKSYEEYAFSKVPKLQRTYRNKTQAIEDFKKQQHAIEMQAKLLAEQVPKDLPEAKPHPYSHGHSPSQASINNTGSWGSGLSDVGGNGTPPTSAPNSAPTTAVSPQPPHAGQFPPGAQHPQSGQYQQAQFQQAYQPSTQISAPMPTDARSFDPGHRTHDSRSLGHSLSSGRARSGSGSYAATMQAVDAKSKEVFSDIAAHSKKGFAAIMQRLGGEREGEVTGSYPPSEATSLAGAPSVRRGSVRHNNGAAKIAKIKREASEADKAYRSGVFHLETLRLRREKLQQSAISSLRDFNKELNETLFQTLRAYAHVSHGTAVTLGQTTDVVFRCFRTVDLGRDQQLFESRLPVITRYPPMLYDNFYVGSCQSLIFGFRLTDYDFARGEKGSHGSPPLIVEKCIAWVDALGHDAEGIYRMSGRQATVRRLIQDIERSEEAFYFTQEDDVYSVAVVLKAYLRDLPDPLFPLAHSERVKWTEHRAAHYKNQFSTLRGKLRRLPPIHQTTFQAVIEHLNRIARNSSENKMDAKNLAVVFNSVLFGQEQVPSDTDALKMHLQKDTVLEDIISHPEFLFPPEGSYGNDPQSPSKLSSTMPTSAMSSAAPSPVMPSLQRNDTWHPRSQRPQHAPLGHKTHGSLSGPMHTPPLTVYATQHPIAAQHARAAAENASPSASTPAPQQQQQPISFLPPSHTTSGHYISAAPPQPALPAGALQPYQPPHPEDAITGPMGNLDLAPTRNRSTSELTYTSGTSDLPWAPAASVDQPMASGRGLTPDEELDLLFDRTKIPASLRDSLPEEYHVRPLASDDFLRAHFGLLATLSPSPAIAPSVYTALFSALKSSHDAYYVVVIVERASDEIIASGTLIRERKFIHGGGHAGHIEDIVVGPQAQGRGLGLKLVTGLRDMATDLGCYKTILDCQEPKVPFYERCGFTLRGRQMAYYVPTTEAPPRRESLAKTAVATSHPSTPSRLPPIATESEDETDIYDSYSVAETADTAETVDTAETYTASSVNYRFPTGTPTPPLPAGSTRLPPGPVRTASGSGFRTGLSSGPASSTMSPTTSEAEIPTPTGSVRSNVSNGRPPAPGQPAGSYF